MAGPLQIALAVESLRQAENLYARLFGMERIREDESESVLERKGLRLLLQAGTVEMPLSDRLAHIGIAVTGRELRQVRRQAEELGCQILAEDLSSLLLEDTLGLRWRLQTAPKNRREHHATEL